MEDRSQVYLLTPLPRQNETLIPMCVYVNAVLDAIEAVVKLPVRLKLPSNLLQTFIISLALSNLITSFVTPLPLFFFGN